MNEDAGLFSTCTSYSQSYNDDAELSDNQHEVSLTRMSQCVWDFTRLSSGAEISGGVACFVRLGNRHMLLTLLLATRLRPKEFKAHERI